MSNPRQEFIEAMRELALPFSSAAKEPVRRACIAFADATCLTNAGTHHWLPDGGCKPCRAALLREVGLEESDGD